MKPIKKAIDAAGGVTRLAEKLGVSKQLVHQWGAGIRPVPAHRCIAIEDASGGAVSRYDLRPDVFGDAA